LIAKALIKFLKKLTKFLPFYLLYFLALNLQAQKDVIYKNLENALNSKDHVYQLDLSRNKLTTFPLEILKLHNLEKLNLSKNRLKDIPPQISKLKNVKVINLSKNNFTSFPVSLTTLKSIEEIILSRNEIISIPSEIKRIKSLKKLDLWSNELSKIPNEISELTNLKELDLRVIQFSDKERDRIISLLPNTKIYFSNSCNCGD